MKSRYLILVLIFTSIAAQSQTSRFFTLHDNNKERNYFQGIIEFNNSFYTSGISNYKGLVVSSNANGDIKWKKIYKTDSALSVQTILTRLNVSIDKKYLIFAASILYLDSTKHSGLKSYPGFIKIDTNGNMIHEWFNYEYYDTLNFSQRVYELQDKNYIFGCNSFSEDQRLHNPSLLLIDSNGNLITRRDYAIFPNKKQVYLNDFIPLKDKGYLLFGYLKAVTSSNYNGMLIRVDSNLNEVWRGEYGRNDFEEISNAIQLKDGHLLVCGYKENANGQLNNYNAWLMKININNGTIVREKEFIFKTANTFRGLTEKTDGSIVLAGEVDNLDTSSSNAHIIKLTPQWEVIWSHDYGLPYISGRTTSNENVFGFTPTTDGGYMMVGFTFDPSLEFPTQDAMMIKVDSNGCLQESCTYTGITQEETELQSVLLYPNPAKESIKIKTPAEEINCVYEIVNTLGEIQMKGRITDEALNIQELSMGIYLLRLYTKSGIVHLKFVKE